MTKQEFTNYLISNDWIMTHFGCYENETYRYILGKDIVSLFSKGSGFNSFPIFSINYSDMSLDSEDNLHFEIQCIPAVLKGMKRHLRTKTL